MDSLSTPWCSCHLGIGHPANNIMAMNAGASASGYARACLLMGICVGFT